MADTPEVSHEDKFGFLVRKIGPLPVWGWGLIAVGIYYWYTHYGPGANSAASGTGTSGNVTETLNTTTGPTSDTGTSTSGPYTPPETLPVAEPRPVPGVTESGGSVASPSPWLPPVKRVPTGPPRVVRTPVHSPPRPVSVPVSVPRP